MTRKRVIPLIVMSRYVLSLKGVVPRRNLFVLTWNSIVGRKDMYVLIQMSVIRTIGL